MHKQDLGKPRVCLLYSSFFVLRALTGGIESMPNQSTAFDVAIIGAGIVGCAAAFELSKTTARVALLDRSNDVGTGTTRANSGIIHAGYDPEPGTRMARFNVEGNALTRQLAGELRVPFVGNGSLVVALSEEDLPVLRGLYERGQANGVPGLELLSGEEARRREPALAGEVCGALWAPTAGIISPWEMAIALADTAVVNGCEFHGGCAVTGIEREADGFRLHTTGGDFLARRVINAAGTHADAVNAFVAAPYFRIQPSKGQYYLLDKSQGELVGATVFQCPSAAGKGVLVSPTVHGNLIVGPDAIPAAGPDDVAVTAQGLSFVAGMARRSVPGFNLRESIRNFAGVRAISDRDDFIVEEAPGCPGFINLSGIKSPGLTSAPALAKVAVALLRKSGLVLQEREGFRLHPRPRPFRYAGARDRAAMAAENPRMGRVTCRCETVTEGEIVEAIHAPVPARSIDGVKRRVGSGMGRCQGGFCSPRIAAILARELNIPLTAVLQDGEGTEILTEELGHEYHRI